MVMEKVHGNSFLDDLTWGTVLKWLPDEGKHTGNIAPSHTKYGELRRRIGCTPLLVGCGACFMHACARETAGGLKKMRCHGSLKAFIRSSLRYEDVHGWTPTYAMLLKTSLER